MARTGRAIGGARGRATGAGSGADRVVDTGGTKATGGAARATGGAGRGAGAGGCVAGRAASGAVDAGLVSGGRKCGCMTCWPGTCGGRYGSLLLTSTRAGRGALWPPCCCTLVGGNLSEGGCPVRCSGRAPNWHEWSITNVLGNMRACPPPAVRYETNECGWKGTVYRREGGGDCYACLPAWEKTRLTWWMPPDRRPCSSPRANWAPREKIMLDPRPSSVDARLSL